MKLVEQAGKTDVLQSGSMYDALIKSGDYYYALRDGESCVELVKLDNNFEEVSSVLTEISYTFDIAYINGLEADSEGRIYILSSYVAQVFDSELNELYNIEIAGNYEGMTACGDKVYVVEGDGTAGILSCIDIETQSLKRINGSFPRQFRALRGTDKKIYIVTTGMLYEYDLETEEIDDALDLIEYGVYGYSVEDIYLENDGSIAMLIDESCITPDDYGLGISVLNKVLADSLPQKQNVVVAAYAPETYNREIYNQLIKFVRSNPDYNISFENYGNDYGEDVTLDEFSRMLITGVDADIILFTSYNADMVKNLADKGIFYDLTGLIEKDEKLDGAIISNVYERMKLDGGLYGISPYCWVDTLTGRESVVGDRLQWSVSRILKILQDNQDLNLFADGSASDALRILLDGGVCMDRQFIENGDLNSDKFMELLELCKLCGERNKSVEMMMPEKAIVDGRAIVVSDNNLLENVRDYYALYGDDNFVRVGYPDDNGGVSVINWWNVFCINNLSENKEAAWNVVRSFFMDDFYDNIFIISEAKMYPTVRKNCEKKINEYIEGQSEKTISIYSIDDNFNINDEASINAPAITREQAEIIVDEINVASVSSYDIDQTIVGIILEEADYFFDGQKTASDVVKIMQDRVQVYLDEQD